MSRQNVLSVVAVLLLACSLLTLNQLNSIVHGDLYSYGLQFSESWAMPYWNLLHLTVVLIVASVVLVLLSCLRKLPFHSRRKGSSRLAELEETATKKSFHHILYFSYVDDAEDFRQLLWSRLPDLAIRLQTIGNRASLSFVLYEPIDDLDSFQTIESFKIKEKEVSMVG